MRLLVETEPIRAKEIYFSEAPSKVEKGLSHFNSKRAYNAKAPKSLTTTAKKKTFKTQRFEY